MLALEFRRRIIEYIEKVIDLHEHPEDKDLGRHWGTQSLESYVKSDLTYWKSEWSNENGEKKYSEIDFDNPYMVSSSWQYKNAIFDIIHIYKVFDWDNYSMVVFGG